MKSKKLLAIVLSAVITFSTVSAVYAAPVGKESKVEPKTTTITWEKNEQNTKKAATDITEKKFNNSEEITKFFEKNISKFGVQKGSLKNTKTVKDEKGKTNYHMIYEVEGIPVYYGRIVFTTEKDSSMDSINGRIDTVFENGNWENRIKLSKDNAIAKAKNDIKDEKATSKKTDLYLYNFEGKPYVVYLVDLITDNGSWTVFVNAEDGSIVNKFNNTPTLIDTKGQKLPNAKKIKDEAKKASNANSVIDVQGQSVKGVGRTSLDGLVNIDLTYGNGRYYLKDSNKNIYLYDLKNQVDEYDLYNYLSRPNYKQILMSKSELISNYNNNFIADNQVNSVDAYVNTNKTYDYYKNKLNRNSIDNKGMNINGFVHVGRNYGNAFWYGPYDGMFFGDGDGVYFSSLAKSLDVVGHELSHGVTNKESNLKYENESGALNESFSDIMGVAVEGKNFVLGEDCWVAGGVMRDMEDPSRGGQPAHMKDYKYKPMNDDNGGVHTNSGIINHAAYLVADGIEKTGAKNSKDIMGKIFYTANCYKWDETTNFAKCRNDVVQVTKELYGENSNYVKIVEKAFDQVGITATPQLPL
ncbi:M4 family metallopeptidase [Clostridium botulinum]|uniref:Neutral metalloproteinase n=2 Tax=Clostridium botulinum TaxID=1491 RepID=A0A846I002_CLOBO|nr:M4 family metallopeptidase [Clostridium botulinum]ACQ54404.1 thermolysin metallopeptidase [Clostridium botulinum Ba4 str. 657]AJE09320.1 thermolysin metallopeptidase, catalytic domain protein [Clostridium botulinum CDC_1436]APR00084.1 thermolysin metallopeptidase, catalytic domain protein [Clostridium botulinum]APU60386.1 thermolysin metallopeptidase, catalytic domain protein [Clostridium botulinum]AUN03019.1 peptidase M4 [Clostridium botulinum]